MNNNQFATIEIERNLQKWKDSSDKFEKESGISQMDMIEDIKKLSKTEQMELAKRLIGL